MVFLFEFKQRHHIIWTILLISGDISLNPRPDKHLCGLVLQASCQNLRAVLCEACNHWCHIKCANISLTEYAALSKSDDPWLCCDCNSFKFTDSFFEISVPNVSIVIQIIVATRYHQKVQI